MGFGWWALIVSSAGAQSRTARLTKAVLHQGTSAHRKVHPGVLLLLGQHVSSLISVGGGKSAPRFCFSYHDTGTIILVESLLPLASLVPSLCMQPVLHSCLKRDDAIDMGIGDTCCP